MFSLALVHILLIPVLLYLLPPPPVWSFSSVLGVLGSPVALVTNLVTSQVLGQELSLPAGGSSFLHGTHLRNIYETLTVGLGKSVVDVWREMEGKWARPDWAWGKRGKPCLPWCQSDMSPGISHQLPWAKHPGHSRLFYWLLYSFYKDLVADW